MIITCSLKSLIKVMLPVLFVIIAMCCWIHAEIKYYETKVEQKWMNYYYNKIIEFEKGNQLHKPINRDEWDGYR